MLNFALEYLKRGWSIIPIPQGSKIPAAGFKWDEFQTRLPTEIEVRKWWTDDPKANIAIVTGVSSGIAVVDVDGPEGIEQAKQFSLPPTVSVKTGGAGLHLFYKHPGVPVKTCRGIVAPKIDVRGDGGYVIAPYSTHETGNKYAWLGGFGSIKNELAPFPKNVLDLLGRPADKRLAGYTAVQSQEPWATELLKGVGSGERHDALIRLAGYFSSKGIPLDVARSILLDWNVRNTPPATDEEVNKQVTDIYTRYPGGCATGSRRSVQPVAGPAASIVTTSMAFSSFRDELKKGAKTIKTGFASLDKYTRGLLVGNISVIGAWPGVGKTAFTLGLARSLAERGERVLYFPTEMAVNELMRVFVSSGLNIPFQRVMDGDLTEAEHAQAADYLDGRKLSTLQIVPNNTPSLEEIAEAVAQAKPTVFMLDYLQHTAGATGGQRTNIQELVMGLKGLAKEYDCAGVLTSQFHRPYKTDGGQLVPPTIYDFAECGQIEREVSMALLMSPVDVERYKETMQFPVNFNLAKNRFGKVQEFQLTFNQEYVRFSE